VRTASVARALGYHSGLVAVSDAGADREIWPFALEVAIVTTVPVVSVTSFQSKPNPKFTPFIVDLASGNTTNGAVAKLTVPVVAGIDTEANVPRAVLRVELEGGRVVYGVHLNSSGLSFCRLDDQKEQAENLAKTAQALGLETEAAAIRDAVARVEDEIARAENPGIAATAAEAFRRASTRGSRGGGDRSARRGGCRQWEDRVRGRRLQHPAGRAVQDRERPGRGFPAAARLQDRHHARHMWPDRRLRRHHCDLHERLGRRDCLPRADGRHWSHIRVPDVR
jgi:hypothetical protein